MNETPQAIGNALREAITDLLVPIQTTKRINLAAFDRLHEEALRLVRAYKGIDDVSKSLLRELLGTYSILRNEAPYFGKDKQTLEDMATKVEACFRLILADEVPEDRQPGVPRFI